MCTCAAGCTGSIADTEGESNSETVQTLLILTLFSFSVDHKYLCVLPDNSCNPTIWVLLYMYIES